MNEIGEVILCYLEYTISKLAYLISSILKISMQTLEADSNGKFERLISDILSHALRFGWNWRSNTVLLRIYYFEINIFNFIHIRNAYAKLVTDLKGKFKQLFSDILVLKLKINY